MKITEDYLILETDIDRSFIELKSQGADIKDITRCQLLGKLMEDKLYVSQAIQDKVHLISLICYNILTFL